MKISIITVTYNSQKTLQRTIDSLLNQNYSDIEYIIVDGNSTDDTVNVIKNNVSFFCKKLKWISEPDKGMYDALNKGIKMATGEVVGILNSDDYFSSENVLSMIAAIFSSEKECDAIYGDVHYVNEQDLTKPIRYYSSKSFKRWKMRFGFMPAHPSFYLKRELFQKYGYYSLDYKVAGDFEFLLRYLYVNKIDTEYIPMDFVTMQTGGLSTSGLKSHKRIFKDHLKALKKNNVYSNSFLLGLRYLYKIIEITLFKLKTIF